MRRRTPATGVPPGSRHPSEARVAEGCPDRTQRVVPNLGSFSQIGAARAIAQDGTPSWCVTFGLPGRRK
jgi:hypothetical protein